MNNIPGNNIFKNCPNCSFTWQSREDFLNDPNTKLIGYQAHINNLEEGLFLFNHHSCKSTMSVLSGNFTSLYSGPNYTDNLHGDESCPEHCLFQLNFEPCPEKCECSYVREIMQIIKAWDKNDTHRNEDGLD